mmetsp:Transcript_3069/g.4685  ORF Transcript_3069/g.4685 Transcript_3069/m.4685 type:complete len:173 (+) Transcript_3069:132-650(+)
MGGSMMACVGLVIGAQNIKDKKLKGSLMYYHKSFGLLAFGMLAPRLYFRLASKLPGPVEGANAIEQFGATASHYLMYGFIAVLPISGVAMGAFSGFGLPFFFTTVPSVKKEPSIAKQAYNIHKQAGTLFEYFVPLHIGGAVYHVLRGHTIFPRILSVLGKAPKAPGAPAPKL